MTTSTNKDAGRSILVTGASSGIGRYLTQYLAERGHRVFAGVRRVDTAPRGTGIVPIQLDVTSDDEAAAAIAAIRRDAGRLDVLVNNAGSSILGAIEETSMAQAKALFDVNVFGALRMSQAVLPLMREQRGGRIINISSVLGLLPGPFMGLYASSKHALEALSETMDHEVRGFGVRVLLVEPGFTRTNIDQASARADRPLPAYDAARSRAVDSIGLQIRNAPDAQAVARVVERAMQAKGFARLPVGGTAAMLSRLRRFLPAKMMDGAIRKSFGIG